jgi:heme-degrading monooxygenase HmoA
MFAVIFEVLPEQGRFDDYLDLAKRLKPELEAIDGFIDNERFESRRTKGRLLSLSIWRDEKSVVRWRSHGGHHAVQEKGRFEVFADYHLRVGEIASDTVPPNGLSVVQTRFDETEVGVAKAITLTEVELRDGHGSGAKPDLRPELLGLDPGADGLADAELFASIYHPGKLILLASWRDEPAAGAWRPRKPDAARSIRHRQVRVIRDYGMFDRREAPQFYPPAQRENRLRQAAAPRR